MVWSHPGCWRDWLLLLQLTEERAVVRVGVVSPPGRAVVIAVVIHVREVIPICRLTIAAPVDVVDGGVIGPDPGVRAVLVAPEPDS